ATAALEAARGAVDLRLRSGDERRQAVDAAIVDHRLGLRLRLILRLRTVLALAAVTLLTMFTRLLLIALIGLAVAVPLALIVVAHIGLRLLRDEARLLAEAGKALVLVVIVVSGDDFVLARLRLVLTELLLGRGDQAEIVFGVLVVVFGGD